MFALTSGTLFAQTLVTVNGQAIDSSVIDDQVASGTRQQPERSRYSWIASNADWTPSYQHCGYPRSQKLKLDQSAEFKQHWNRRMLMPPSKAQIKSHIQNRMGSFENDLLEKLSAAHIDRQYPVQEKMSKPLTTTSATSIKVLRSPTRRNLNRQQQCPKAIADLDAKKKLCFGIEPILNWQAAKSRRHPLKLMFQLKVGKNQLLRFTLLSKTWKKVRTLKRRCKTVMLYAVFCQWPS